MKGRRASSPSGALSSAPGDGRAARLALSPDEAAAALGCSRTFLDEHVMPDLRVVRVGRRRFIAVTELSRWLDEHASRAVER